MKDQIIAAPWEPASTVMSEKSFPPAPTITLSIAPA
jgi:hypothetical protein